MLLYDVHDDDLWLQLLKSLQFALHADHIMILKFECFMSAGCLIRSFFMLWDCRRFKALELLWETQSFRYNVFINRCVVEELPCCWQPLNVNLVLRGDVIDAATLSSHVEDSDSQRNIMFREVDLHVSSFQFYSGSGLFFHFFIQRVCFIL